MLRQRLPSTETKCINIQTPILFFEFRTGNDFKTKGRSKRWMTSLPEGAAKKLRPVAAKCMCELLAAHPHFNFRTDVISCVVPMMSVNTDQVVLLFV